jgi:hypothetical protein
MSHHSPDPMTNDLLRKLFSDDAKSFGPTRQFPEGKLTPSDEGEIRLGVTTLNGKVVMDFGSPVTWIGFNPSQARGIAELLLKHADAIEPPSSLAPTP